MNLYQPTITGSLKISGSVEITGSLIGSAVTASYATNLTVSGTITAQTLVVQTITSSIDYVTGSTRFGSLAANTHVFTGSLLVTGSSHTILGNLGVGGAPNERFSVTGPLGLQGFVRWSDGVATSAFLGITGSTAFIHANNSTLGFGANSSNNYSPTMIVSSSNVGIGTINPVYALDIAGSTARVKASGGNLYGGFLADNSNATGGGFFSALKNGSQIGIFGVSGAALGDTSNNMILYNDASTAIDLYTSNALRLRVSSNGYTKMTNGGAFLGGTYHEFVNSTTNNYITTFANTSASPFGMYIVYPNASPNGGTNNEFIWCVDSTNSKFIVWSNGTASNRTGTYGTISSDLRLKENITPATSKLNDLMSLNVVNFTFKEDTDKKKQIGFIAQEFREVFPSLVYEKDTREYDEDGNVTKGLEDSLGLNVGMEFAILVKAIQELKADNDAIRAELAALKS